jgi:hypothetical protein
MVRRGKTLECRTSYMGFTAPYYEGHSQGRKVWNKDITR